MARAGLAWLGVALVAVGCGGTLDAGTDQAHGPLPVDERNPVILDQDDWSVDWLPEYAALLANSGGPPLVGIIVNSTPFWMNLNTNVSGWNDFLTAARTSGLKNLPDVTPSPGGPLTRPADGQIDSTAPNDSAGAQLIRDLSRQLSTPTRPVVVACSTSLTDLASAYLLDHTVVDRVVVVAAAGQYQAPNGVMAVPNGNMDPWADWIVEQRYTFIQAGTWYDQTGDVPTALLSSLPQNPLVTWMANKQSMILSVTTASDQVGLLSFALPMFTVMAQKTSPDTSAGFDSTQGPPLVPDPNGRTWVVTQVAAPLASSRLWSMLSDTSLFTP